MRADGRHELVTLFESVSLYDELTFVGSAAGEAQADGADQVVCEGVEGPNLVADALAGLRARGWEGPPLRVEIEKRVPIAAGMGGGSADAAAVLRVAPRLAPIAPDHVAELAAVLGADVPAALAPGVAVGTAAGEHVRPVAPLASHCFVIVPADRQLSTAAVYAEADRLGLSRDRAELETALQALDAVLLSGAQLPPELLVNDLERAAGALCPDIGYALGATAAAGADHAFVCGSGPTVAGLFWGEDGGARAAAAAERLRRRFPLASAVAPVSSQAFGKMAAER